jgi:hypothetical protein
MSVAEQIQSVVAAGIVIVQVPVLLVPTLTLKAAVPLFVEMEAPDPPHPAAATDGSVLLMNVFSPEAIPKVVAK